MTIEVVLQFIGDIESFKGDTFSKRSCVVQTEEAYSNDYLIDFLKHNCELLDGYNEGDRVKITCDLRGKRYTKPDQTEGYFTSIVGWAISRK